MVRIPKAFREQLNEKYDSKGYKYYHHSCMSASDDIWPVAPRTADRQRSIPSLLDGVIPEGNFAIPGAVHGRPVKEGPTDSVVEEYEQEVEPDELQIVTYKTTEALASPSVMGFVGVSRT